jgi:hypothetical protein
MPRLVTWIAAVLALTTCERERGPARASDCTLRDARVSCVLARASDLPPPPLDEQPSGAYTVRIPGEVNVTAADLLGRYACAIADGRVYCWGAGDRGVLGDGIATAGSRGPVRVAGVERATQVATEFASACALHRGGAVTCWGSLAAIAVREDMPDEPRPSRLHLPPATAIVAGGVQMCAIVEDGAMCWGGRYAHPDRVQPSTHGITLIPGTRGAATVRPEGTAMCAVWPDAAELCWSTTALPLGVTWDGPVPEPPHGPDE